MEEDMNKEEVECLLVAWEMSGPKVHYGTEGIMRAK